MDLPQRLVAALLPFLLAHASSPNYTVSFGWKPGDFVLWHNQATWHYAVNDYDGPRVYRKSSAASTRPGKRTFREAPVQHGIEVLGRAPGPGDGLVGRVRQRSA